MATKPLTPLVTAEDLTTSYQTIYTVPSGTDRVGIDAVVVNNYSLANAEYSVQLVQSGSATGLNEVISDKMIRAGANDLAPAMIGQALNEGGEIRVKASSNNSLNMHITGTVITE